MECGCKTTTNQLYIEGEFGADPVWCAVCNYNIELDELPINEELSNELLVWGNSFGQWIDIEDDSLVDGWEQLVAEHNKQGALLAKKLQMALGGVKVAFNAAE